METKPQDITTLTHAMKQIAEKYGFELFSVDLVAAFDESPYRQCHPKSIIFFTQNTDQQLIAFLSFWHGTWHPLHNPQKYNVAFNSTRPDFTKAIAIKFTQELNDLTTISAESLTPLDFITVEDWQQMS